MGLNGDANGCLSETVKRGQSLGGPGTHGYNPGSRVLWSGVPLQWIMLTGR